MRSASGVRGREKGMEGGISEEEKTKLGIRGRERGGALHMKEGDKGKRIGRGGVGIDRRGRTEEKRKREGKSDAQRWG